jgi:hypothetical protein
MSWFLAVVHFMFVGVLHSFTATAAVACVTESAATLGGKRPVLLSFFTCLLCRLAIML